MWTHAHELSSYIGCAALHQWHVRLCVTCTGTLPDAWGNNTASLFNHFNLSGNHFNGSIPGSWAQLMVSSRSFDLSRLQLSGGLPAALWGDLNTTQLVRYAGGLRVVTWVHACSSCRGSDSQRVTEE